MRADVVFLTSYLTPNQLEGRVVVVLDVLRATTTMIAALAHGVREIRVFPDTQSARQAAKAQAGAVLCGEEQCLKPSGFDLGNRPGEFNVEHAGRTVFMSTTNGTRAIIAARGAAKVLVGGLVNASAVAKQIRRLGRDVILLCAGTNGQVAMEDVIGAGAILEALGSEIQLETDAARLALRVFRSARENLRDALRESAGGVNVIRAGLDGDIDYAARIDSHQVVGMVLEGDPMRIGLLSGGEVG
jgi:2-phosphosulfolactate phosphatase